MREVEACTSDDVEAEYDAVLQAGIFGAKPTPTHTPAVPHGSALCSAGTLSSDGASRGAPTRRAARYGNR